jgi:hypothetical protein
MGIVNLRNTVSMHLFRERFEVMLAVLIPFVFMVESGYACAWILVDGHLGLDAPSLMAFARGFAIEAFVFVCFKLVRIFWLKGSKFSIIFPLVIGAVGVVVSSGMNLGWMIQSPEMRTVMGAISSYMPTWMASTFRLGLGLLFPVGVALFALFDVRHLIDEMIASSHLDDRAMIIHQAEQLRKRLMQGIKRSARDSQEQLDEIARINTQRIVDAVKAGDMSFGANAARHMTSSSVTKVQPGRSVSPAQPAVSHRQNALPPGQQVQQLPPLQQPVSSGASQPHP